MKKIIVIGIILCAVSGITYLLIVSAQKHTQYVYSQPIVYAHSDTFPVGREIPDEYKQLAESVYENYSKSLSKIYVTMNTSTYKLIRFTFVTNEELSEDDQRSILDNISMFWEGWTENVYYYTRIVEIFFASEQVPYASYVSWYISTNMDNTAGKYDDWIEVPNIKGTLTWDALQQMMSKYGVYYPMFISQQNQISGMQPNLTGEPQN